MVKVQSYVMLILPNMTMEPSNVRKKKTIEYGKSRVICNVGIAYYNNRTIKCEKTNKGTIDCYNFIPNKNILLN